MKAIRTAAVVLVAAVSVGVALTLLEEEAVTQPKATPKELITELSSANAALTKRVADLRIAIGAAQAAGCAECAERAERAERAPPTETAPAAKTKSAAPPTSLEGWLALAVDGVFPAGFHQWLGADPARLLELIASLDGITDPALSQAVVDQIKRTRGALRNPELQRALFELTQEAKTPAGRTGALRLLGEAFKRDALASERLTPGERQELAALALSGPLEVRRAAIDALMHMPDDPSAVAAFSRAWNDPQLPPATRRQAIVGLRFAPQDVALPILLDSLTSPDGLPVQLRQQAAVSLSYLNPQSAGDEVFQRLAPTLATETDWVAKGFTFVALMQIDNGRAHSLLRDLQLAERDPWDAEKYAALAEIASRESDYQRIVWQGIRAYRRIEARREASSR